MIKKLGVLAVFALLLLQHPAAQGPGARIYFADIGQGAGTLIVSPTGKTLLVDGGPPGGGTKIGALLTTLNIATIDFTVITHYHIDHVSGVTELLNAGRVAGIAYDNGDGPDVAPPGVLTSPSSTRGTYLNYIAATNRPGVTRQTIAPGQVIDLGGGMQVTCLAAGGRFLSGGSVPITNDDLNSESVSLLVEFNNFDYIVSGDITGGGSTSTAKTPDVETYVGQIAGDVDVVQLNHHGSTTTNNQSFLSAIKAEVAVAEASDDNSFGHPNRESVNKYLNTPVSNGHVFTGTGVPPPGAGPVYYQTQAAVPGDDRVTLQAYTGAGSGNGGKGTLLLQTDGLTTYSIGSLDDGFARLSPAVHVYPVDGASPGVTTHFPPTVVAQTLPVAPLAGVSVVVSAAVRDRESPIASVTLNYALNGVAQPALPMTLSGGMHGATIPGQPDGTRVDYSIAAVAAGRSTTYASGYFSGTTAIAGLRALNQAGEPLYTGYAARIRGTVSASAFSAGTNDDYVADATGAINVYKSTTTPTPFTSTAPGQAIDAVGRLAFSGGRIRLDLTESVEKATSPYGITIVSPGATPLPQPVTIAQLNAGLEAFEGRLVSIANTAITGGSIPAAAQPFDTFVTVSDGTAAIQLKIDRDTDIEGFTPAGTFTLVGIVQQDDYLRPFDSGYNVAPRSRVDLGAAAPTPPALLTIADARADRLNNVDGTAVADLVPDRINQIVRVRGVVTSIDFRGGNGIEYYIQDATAGVDLFSTAGNFGTFAPGDSIEAIGVVTQFNGLTELAVSAVSLLGPGTAVTPQVVTLSQLASGAAGEALEGRLVRVNNVTVSSGTIPASGVSANLTIADATGSADLRIDSDTNIDGMPTPAGAFSVIGVVGQSDSTPPFDSRYQIFPRSTADILSAAPMLTATPAAVDFGSVPAGGSALATVIVANAGGASVTLTVPFALTGASANQFAAGAPAAQTLAAGESTPVTITFAPASSGSKAATLTISGSGGTEAAVSLTGTAQGSAAGAIVISELRTRGPAGANDEFVEIYNNSDAAIDISGYKLKSSSAGAATSTRASAPGAAGSGTTLLPARSHYLFTKTGGYSGAVPGNAAYSSGIADAGGVAITTAADAILDQVGFSAGSAFREGSALAPFAAGPANRSYERKAGGFSGSQVDTGSNANDFAVTTPSDPQNLAAAPTPGFSVSPSSVNFGTVAPGATVRATLTLTNPSGTASLTLTAPFALTGPDAASFSAAGPAAGTLAAGGATTVVVTFQPAASGPKTATLTVTSARGTRLVALSGTADP